jgi:hypothetical protein
MANKVQIETVVTDVIAELRRAEEKFAAFNSSHEGYAVILEELDELWDEIKGNKREGSTDRQYKEAMQVAAMGMRFMLFLKLKEIK